jgi:hypothetical protein
LKLRSGFLLPLREKVSGACPTDEGSRRVFPLAWVLLSACALSACGGTREQQTFYVEAASSNTTRFTRDLGEIVVRHGLAPKLGQATDDRGNTIHVLEATGHWLRLWAQNVPASGSEDPSICGSHTETYTDPGQYVIVIGPRLGLAAAQDEVRVTSAIKGELSARGYEVRAIPLACSRLARTAP